MGQNPQSAIKIDRSSELNDAVTKLEAVANQIVTSGNDPGSPWAMARQAEIEAYGARIRAEVALAMMATAQQSEGTADQTRRLVYVTIGVAIATLLAAVAALVTAIATAS
jgi:hypothetical protein